MTRRLLTGNGAAAWGARLAKVDYVPAFPITPQTEIIETLSEWFDNDEIPGRMTTLESEHSMITAAGAAAITGVRVFTATSSQGLLYGMEMLYNIAGWRAPLVMINVSRGLSAPITLEPDHNDILAARDSGCLQIHCATCQEVLDSTLIAFRLAEHKKVRLPVIVNLDGFYLSFTREPVDIPDTELAAKFVGPFDPENTQLRASSPTSQAVAVLGGSPYSYFRYELHLAAQQALGVYDEVAAEFSEQFGRDYAAIETYRNDDAEFAFVMMGCFATKAREAVDRLRDAGWRIGLVRPRLLRPFPEQALRNALGDKKAVAVVDQNISMGKGGVLHTEVASVLYGLNNAPLLASFIGGLGGRDIPQEELFEMANVLKSAVEKGEAPPARLLYTADELREMRKLQAIAHVERHELKPGKGLAKEQGKGAGND
jgi:pyruvate ferredoxin oxidoreductase alpha subunit